MLSAEINDTFVPFVSATPGVDIEVRRHIGSAALYVRFAIQVESDPRLSNRAPDNFACAGD